MKRKSKFLCLILVLVMMVSMLPMQAAADDAEQKETGTVTVKVVVGKKTLYTYEVEVGDEPVTLKNDKYIEHKKKFYEHSHYTVSGLKVKKVTIPAYSSSNAADWKKTWGNTIKVVYTNHSHDFDFGFNRIYHWRICDCGHTTDEVRHVDPLKDTDKICSCGYAFSNNADLTTLWLSNMVLSPNFTKENANYTAKVHTYLDVNSTKITAHPFDALAKVELPENLEIHEGANKFEIKVTAEDKTTTKIYTVIAVKPMQVEDSFVFADGTTVSVALKPTIKNLVATATLSQAVADKMVELAAADKSSAISLQPEFSKWSIRQVEIPLSTAFLTAISEKTQANLVVVTPYGSTLTVPHAQLASLAEGRDSVTLCIGRDHTFSILANGETITVPQEITLTLPEA